MKAYSVSMINAIFLIALSAWGYFSSDTPSMTALIPAIIGILLILCNNGVKKESKVIAHILSRLTSSTKRYIGIANGAHTKSNVVIKIPILVGAENSAIL